MREPDVATCELLAPRNDVWAFVSVAGRLADWWPGVKGAQDDGQRWEIAGDERVGGQEVRRSEGVAVEKEAPTRLHLHFERSGIDAELNLEATASNRTTATLSIDVRDPNETLVERLEHGVPLFMGQAPSAAVMLDKLYDLCQTGADA